MRRIENIFCNILRGSLSEQELLDVSNMSSADWSSIYEIALHNNLLPLLYYKLKTHKIHIPPSLETTLRNHYLGCTGKDFQRKRQLVELVKTLNIHGIDHILLKGSHLAEKVYINSVLRPMCDIDILVRKKDIERAFRILIDEGYCDDSGHGGPNIVKNVYVHHYPVLLKDKSFPIELHHYLFEYNDLTNIDLIWLRAQKVAIGDMTSKVMSIEDLLIHIALHGLRYHTQKLGINFVYDLRTIISFGSINWNTVAELIKENDWGNSKTLYSSLIMAKTFFHTDIPADFLASIKPADFNQNIQVSIEELIWYRQACNQTEAYTFSYYLFHSLKKMSLKHIVRQSLFSPEQISSEVRTKYKGWKIIVLYFQSLMSIISTFLGIIYQCLIGNNETKKAVKTGRKAGTITHWLES